MIARTISFVALLLPSLAFAETEFWLTNDRININLGAFITEFDGEGRATSDAGRGTKIDLEDDLGLEESVSVARLDTSFRISSRHSVQFSYIDLSREGDNVTERPLLINDTLYPVGSDLDVDFDYRVYKLAYTYSIWQTPDYDLGFTTGLHIFEVGLTIKTDLAKTEDSDETAPFPMFGLRGSWLLDPDVFFRTSIEYFAISEGDVEGSLLDILVSIEYKFSKRWGFGIGYNHLDLEAENSDSQDELDYEYDGILLYGKLVY
ncbi:MAG: DUF481 domain-containing protein [Gammaproteobacteria bacterium]|nr:MAG: DUF481 domain-containing protein [Gammaproteobacteria bacterium]